MSKILFEKEHIFLKQKFETKEEAIKFAGDKLNELSLTEEKYTESMLNREKLLTTYIGKGIAIPHGDRNSQELINKSGIIFIQLSYALRFTDEDSANVIFASAGYGNDNLKILAGIAKLSKNSEVMDLIKKSDDIDKIYDVISKYIK